MKFLKALFGVGKPSDQSLKQPPRPEKPTPIITQASPKASPSKAHVSTDLKSFPFNVVGESHYQNALEKIAGGYRRDSQSFTVKALIAIDPENRFDPDAVRVEIDDQTVGYLPGPEAKRIGEIMRAQGVSAATVEAQVRGGWRTNQHDQGHFGVRLRMPQSGWVDFGVGASKPASNPPVPRVKKPAVGGPLSKEKIALWGFTRDGEEASSITRAGGQVMASVGKSTTIVVTSNYPMTPGMKSSATWKKLEELRSAGHSIELITLSEIQSRIAAG